MTASKAQEQAAAQAVAAGEAFREAWANQSEREARTTNGSDQATSQASLEPPDVTPWPS